MLVLQREREGSGMAEKPSPGMFSSERQIKSKGGYTRQYLKRLMKRLLSARRMHAWKASFFLSSPASASDLKAKKTSSKMVSLEGSCKHQSKEIDLRREGRRRRRRRTEEEVGDRVGGLELLKAAGG